MMKEHHYIRLLKVQEYTVALDYEEQRKKNIFVVSWAETGGRKWLASLRRQPHPQLRVKQQQLRLATVTGTGEKTFRVPLSG